MEQAADGIPEGGTPAPVRRPATVGSTAGLAAATAADLGPSSGRVGWASRVGAAGAARAAARLESAAPGAPPPGGWSPLPGRRRTTGGTASRASSSSSWGGSC
jgi:hypothetical protein